MGTADERLGRALEAGRAAHPGIDVATPALRPFLDRWAARPGASAMDDDSARSTRVLADLFLAAGCASDASGSWTRVKAVHEGRLRTLLASRNIQGAEADALLAGLWGRLEGRDAAGRRSIATYDGSGTLGSWLAVQLLVQVPTPAPQSARPAIMATLVADSAEELLSGLDSSWEDLTPRERLAVLLHHRDGLPAADVARVLAVSENRATRLVRTASGRLQEGIVRRLEDRGAAGATRAAEAWRRMVEAFSLAPATGRGTAP